MRPAPDEVASANSESRKTESQPNPLTSHFSATIFRPDDANKTAPAAVGIDSGLVEWIPAPPGFATSNFAEGQDWTFPPPNPQAVAEEEIVQGHAREKEGDHLGALQSYWRIYTLWPNSESAGIALARLAKVLWDSGDYVRAALVMEKGKKEYPEHIDEWQLQMMEAEAIYALLRSGLSRMMQEGGVLPDGSISDNFRSGWLTLTQSAWLATLAYARGYAEDDAEKDARIPALNRLFGMQLGIIYLYLNEMENATSTWQSVADEFPDTQSARYVHYLLPIISAEEAKQISERRAAGYPPDVLSVANLLKRPEGDMTLLAAPTGYSSR